MLRVKTRLGPSAIHGTGLFSEENLPAGTVVWRLDPAVDLRLTRAQFESLTGPGGEQVRKYCYKDLVLGEYILCGDDARFFNHSDEPNCLDYPDEDGGTTVAARDIRAGEELTSDYAAFDAEHQPYVPR